MLEDGRLTDGHGRHVDFRNTVVIMTSNLGTGEYGKHQTLGFKRGEADYETEKNRVRTSVDDALKKAFRPEFLNRLDETIIFDPLTRDDIHQIVELMANAVQERLVEQKIGIELSSQAKDWLANEGYDPIFGARPLRRAMQRYVENPIANRILSSDVSKGDTVLVSVDEVNNKLTFTKTAVRVEEVATA